ncbi:Protein hook, partial [Pseudolycoriella hygida]
MESEKLAMYEGLIEWLKMLNLTAPHSNVRELSDGVAFAQALHQIASDSFDDAWLAKIKLEVGSNWRLKVSNLKKVVESILDYYANVLSLSLSDFPKPDVLKIAEKNDSIEVGRLLQLILGCAINCSQKQKYITQIIEAESEGYRLQSDIMKAMQELENIWQGTSASRTSLSVPYGIPLVFEEKTAQEEEFNKFMDRYGKWAIPIEKLAMCESLIKWFKMLNLTAPHSNVRELSDGVAFAQALHQIASDSFDDAWLAKIKLEVGSNWRLKVSNLKKVVESILDYYADVLSLSLSDFPKPDVLKIAEKNDSIELGRLLQLILGCAINCSQKQEYITQIIESEEALQRDIMKAIQELENIWQGTSASRTSLSLPTFDVKVLQDERDVLAQKCHEAEQRIALLLDEKFTQQQEFNKLQRALDRYENSTILIGDDGTSLGPAQPGSARYTELRRQHDALKDELILAETARDDFKIKSFQQQKEIAILQTKVEELQHSASELAVLKDEIDVLREASDKLKICEAQLATYKKKLEDHNDLKRQIKMLEDRSAEYIQQNVQQEENIKKHSTLKSQMELYKKEIEELHAKLDAEMIKSVKVEFELSNVSAKLTAIQREKDSLLTERDALRETCDELQCNQVSGEQKNAMSREIMSPNGLKERMERLESENRALREGQGNETVLAQYMDESNQRIEKLREQLKLANQKILSLSHGQGDDKDQKEQKASPTADETQTQIGLLQNKVGQLEAALTARDQELAAADARYRKSVEKTKEIIKTIDPKALATETILHEKSAEHEQDTPRPMGPVEERLMATAFYRLGLACQRDSVDAKLSLMNGAGQSFLTRQRQPAARKTVSYKAK